MGEGRGCALYLNIGLSCLVGMGQCCLLLREGQHKVVQPRSDLILCLLGSQQGFMPPYQQIMGL